MEPEASAGRQAGRGWGRCTRDGAPVGEAIRSREKWASKVGATRLQKRGYSN